MSTTKLKCTACSALHDADTILTKIWTLDDYIRENVTRYGGYLCQCVVGTGTRKEYKATSDIVGIFTHDGWWDKLALLRIASRTGFNDEDNDRSFMFNRLDVAYAHRINNIELRYETDSKQLYISFSYLDQNNGTTIWDSMTMEEVFTYNLGLEVPQLAFSEHVLPALADKIKDDLCQAHIAGKLNRQLNTDQ